MAKKRTAWNKGKKLIQFCPQGHDTFVCGRTPNGCCMICQLKASQDWHKKHKNYSKDYMAARYISHPQPKKQFCLRGHDTFMTGRTKHGNCKVCKNEDQIKANIEKVKNDPHYKLVSTLRIRLYHAIKNNYKAGSAIRDLGCTIEFLKQYITKKFYGDMTWSNWGTYWELDHIKELASFDLTDKEQFLQAVHYTNLQPLTVEDHLKKTMVFLKELKKDLAHVN